MATSLRNSNSATATTGTAVAVAAPTGTVTGDHVVCLVHCNGVTTIADNNGATPFTEDLPDYAPNTTGGHTIAIFSRRIVASDPSTYNFTIGLSGRWTVQALTFQNPHPTSFYDVAPSTANANAQDNSTNGNATVPSINTLTPNAIHVALGFWDTGSGGAITEPGTYNNIIEGGNQPIGSSYKVIAAAGATGALTYANAAFSPRIGISFAVQDESNAGAGKFFAFF